MIEKPMKPFDLEAALEGAPVITADGLLVTSLKYFAELDATPHPTRCVVGVVHWKDGPLSARWWLKNGESEYGDPMMNLHMA